MNKKGLQIFVGKCCIMVKESAQITLINGSFSEVLLTYIVCGKLEVSKFKKDDCEFLSHLSLALGIVAFDKEVYKEMWESLSTEAQELANKLYYTEKGWDIFEFITDDMSEQQIKEETINNSVLMGWSREKSEAVWNYCQKMLDRSIDNRPKNFKPMPGAEYVNALLELNQEERDKFFKLREEQLGGTYELDEAISKLNDEDSKKFDNLKQMTD